MTVARISLNTTGTYPGTHGGALKDSRLIQHLPTYAVGSDADVHFGYFGTTNQRVNAIFEFPLPAAVQSASAINSVTLRMYVSSVSGAPDFGPFDVHEVLLNFAEDQACWNERTTGVSWGTAGATGGADIGSVLGTFDCTVSSGWMSWSASGIATALNAAKASGVFRLLIKGGPSVYDLGTQPNNVVLLLSKETADGTRPVLEIDYTAGVSAPVFSGTIPTLTGTQGVAMAAQSPTIASYFTGTGITYTVSTALPAGLSINSGTGVISGTPSTGDDWSGYVTATNGGGSDDSNTFAITISAASSPVAFSGTVPAQSGTVGTAYTPLALASYFTGSFTPYTYSVFSGALPGGLSLNTSTGEITGTPTTAGSFSAVVRATDTATNTANTGTIAWTILAAMATTVSVTLTTDGTTPAASLTALKWAYWDVVTPDLMTTAPLVKGSAETTDGSGVLTVTITGTTKRVGEVGYLLVTNSDGTTTQGAALRAFAAPVTVS